ncbi:Rne/Rng family ribonuclease [bacterium]|nr:Rne/Rng family ribonuclease [bacterium]
MKKKVLINVEDKDIRVAILEDGQLSQLFIEPLDQKTIVGNVYKAVVESIVPGLQAVFVDIGEEKNAFLHFSDVHSGYRVPTKGAPQHGGRQDHAQRAQENAPSLPEEKGKRVELKVGDSILVQAVKEPINTKGARVTTHVSLPGRYLVLLPFSGSNGGGVSRRIEDGAERRRLRDILRSLKADDGGFIIRTAGLEQDEGEISADVQKLKRIWTRIRRSSAQKTAPCLIHDEHEILVRLVRDEMTPDVDELIIDSKVHAKILKAALDSLLPDDDRKLTIVENPEENLFDLYDVERQFQKALKRKVWLKSGGYIVIDETEALVSIDVNTGKFVGKGDQEDTIFQTNLEAADTVTRQLRLRDVGGIIVVDFIDMRSRENQRKLVQKFKEFLKVDRAKTTVSALSEYGLLEMTRKRVRQSLSKTIFRECPYCQGSGRVLSEKLIWKAIKYDILQIVKRDETIHSLQITIHPQMRLYLEEHMLEAARGIANIGQVALNFVDEKEYHMEQYNIAKLD